MGNETSQPVGESRFDLQQMLAEIATEDGQQSNKKVEQAEIGDLFKNRKKRGDE